MKRKLMLLLACLFVGIGLATAQTQKVTGVVISEEDGQPVIGATVRVADTDMGTITDVDGTFTLNNVPSSANTLIISFVGMQTQEVGIQPNVRVTLKSDAERGDGGGLRYGKEVGIYWFGFDGEVGKDCRAYGVQCNECHGRTGSRRADYAK